MKNEILQQIEVLLKSEKISDVESSIKKYFGEFKKIIKEEDELLRKKLSENVLVADSQNGVLETIDSSGENHTNENIEISQPENSPVISEILEEKNTAEHDEFVLKFKELETEFKNRITAYRKERDEKWSKNLKEKKQIIQDFKDLIENEENIGKAFSKYNQVRDNWKNSGEVASADYREIQHEYSMLLDLFNYNIHIYKELKEHDFKKNLEIKNIIISEQEKLIEETSISKIEQDVRINQERWNEIGPTYKEQWEDIKERFWKATKACYKKIQDHYDERRSHMQENLDKQKLILEKVKLINTDGLKNTKKWQEKSDELIALQNEWKLTGFVPKEEGDAIWKEFRSVCNTFFDSKRMHFEEIRKVHDANRDMKTNLVSKAQNLKDSVDWKKSTDELINIQKDWKAVGACHQKDENKLWNQFRESCDHFFNNKKLAFASEDAKQIENLSKKEALIIEVANYELTGNKEDDLKRLNELSDLWRSIEHVPFKEKDRVNKSYSEAMQGKYETMKLESKEKDNLLFKNKLESMKGNQFGQKLIDKEKEFILNAISKLNAEIIQYENNIGFFAKSKGADKLREDVNRKIDSAKEKIASLKDKLKLLRQGQ
jgi:Domain of Unknown Function (DUF349)